MRLKTPTGQGRDRQAHPQCGENRGDQQRAAAVPTPKHAHTKLAQFLLMTVRAQPLLTLVRIYLAAFPFATTGHNYSLLNSAWRQNFN